MALRAGICVLALVSIGHSLASAQPARTILDTDPICRTDGCVVVSDGVNFDIFDARDPVTGATVPRGGALFRRQNNPLAGAFPVGPFITGTTIPANQNTGDTVVTEFGFDQDGDGSVDIFSETDTNGILDAEDRFSSFVLTAETTFLLSNGTLFGDGGGPTGGQGPFGPRSFFISSRGLSVDMTATAVLLDNGPTDLIENLPFNYTVTTSGTNAGTPFGGEARPTAFRRVNGVTTVGDILSVPAPIAEFRGSIRRRPASGILDQSFRFDYLIEPPQIDLSAPTAPASFGIDFDFTRR